MQKIRDTKGRFIKGHPGFKKKIFMDKKEYLKFYYLSCPWAKTMKRIRSRCYPSSPYGLRGVKNYITIQDLKFLWFRDRAYLLKHPSIDRINPKGNYTLENCRYIEVSENHRKKGG